MLALGFVHRDGVGRQLPKVREKLRRSVVPQQKGCAERAQCDDQDDRGIEHPAH
jgi:hypothetical protein